MLLFEIVITQTPDQAYRVVGSIVKECAMKRYLKANFLPLAIGFFAGVVIVLVFSFLRADLKNWHLDANQGRIWEIILKAIAGSLALSGAIVAVLKYLDDKAAAVRAIEKEAIKDLLAMRQDIYARLIKSMAKIMNYDPGDTEWVPAKMTFFEIFWGELRWVWNEEVEAAAEKYSNVVFKYKGGPKDEIIALSEDVVRACRKSLGEAWNFEKDLIPRQPLKSTKQYMEDRNAQR
jgi:hypothetical protein